MWTLEPQLISACVYNPGVHLVSCASEQDSLQRGQRSAFTCSVPVHADLQSQNTCSRPGALQAIWQAARATCLLSQQLTVRWMSLLAQRRFLISSVRLNIQCRTSLTTTVFAQGQSQARRHSQHSTGGKPALQPSMRPLVPLSGVKLLCLTSCLRSLGLEQWNSCSHVLILLSNLTLDPTPGNMIRVQSLKLIRCLISSVS